MNTDAYCCPSCGYFETERSAGKAPERVACPACSAPSSRLLTPPVLARMNPAVGAGLPGAAGAHTGPDLLTPPAVVMTG